MGEPAVLFVIIPYQSPAYITHFGSQHRPFTRGSRTAGPEASAGGSKIAPCYIQRSVCRRSSKSVVSVLTRLPGSTALRFNVGWRWANRLDNRNQWTTRNLSRHPTEDIPRGLTDITSTSSCGTAGTSSRKSPRKIPWCDEYRSRESVSSDLAGNQHTSFNKI